MSYQQLTENERYQISIMNKAGHRQQAIADMLVKHPSTISRELRRNIGLRDRPAQAHRLTQRRRREAYKAHKMTVQVTIGLSNYYGKNSALSKLWITWRSIKRYCYIMKRYPH